MERRLGALSVQVDLTGGFVRIGRSHVFWIVGSARPDCRWFHRVFMQRVREDRYQRRHTVRWGRVIVGWRRQGKQPTPSPTR